MLNLRNNQPEMTPRPKLIIFIILLLSPLFITSCYKENDVIPDTYIDFYISLDDVAFLELNAIGGSVTISSSTNNFGTRAAGYDNNGIIVYRASEDEFYAYDRTCPHDFVTNNKSVKINIVDVLFAECPDCKTRYALPNNGTPSSGVGRYPLKNYKTAFTGLIVHVWNY